MLKQKVLIVILLMNVIYFAGCDAIYRLLQKEGAQEKDIIGEIVPFEANEKVEEVQKLLKIYGYNTGKADGVMGAKTRNAIAEFQEAQGLKVSRFVDQPTWEKLKLFEDCALVWKGDLNLKGVQVALKAAGFDPGPADGKMGNRTMEAIKSFQKAKGLKIDGKIGYNTLNHLKNYLVCESK